MSKANTLYGIRSLATFCKAVLSYSILSAGFQHFVIERLANVVLEDRSWKMRIRVHRDVLAQPSPAAPPHTGDADWANAWRLSETRNLTMSTAALFLYVDSIQRTFDKMDPTDIRIRSASRPVGASTSPSAPPNVASSAQPPGSSRKRGRSPEGSVEATAPSTSSAATTHALLCQWWPFAGGSSANAFHSCLMPIEKQECSEVSYYRFTDWHACMHDGHLRTITKSPRSGTSEDWTNVGSSQIALGPAVSSDVLEREAALYEELRILQGSTVIPFYYGEWSSELGVPAYVFEDVGVSVSQSRCPVLRSSLSLTNDVILAQLDSPKLTSLDLSKGDKAEVQRLLVEKLNALHAQGYVHQDVFARNLCIRRAVHLTPSMASAPFVVDVLPNRPAVPAPLPRHEPVKNSPAKFMSASPCAGSVQANSGKLPIEVRLIDRRIDLSHTRCIRELDERVSLARRDQEHLLDVFTELRGAGKW